MKDKVLHALETNIFLEVEKFPKHHEKLILESVSSKCDCDIRTAQSGLAVLVTNGYLKQIKKKKPDTRKVYLEVGDAFLKQHLKKQIRILDNLENHSKNNQPIPMELLNSIAFYKSKASLEANSLCNLNKFDDSNLVVKFHYPILKSLIDNFDEELKKYHQVTEHLINYWLNQDSRPVHS
jgi:hypothetical protein